MKARDKLSVSHVLRFFYCNPKKGTLTYKHRPQSDFDCRRSWILWNGRFEGRIAGGIRPTGYVYVKVSGVAIAVHRIIWAHVYGKWPSIDDESAFLDHKNHNRSDNRICNLRICNKSENNRNADRRKDNTSGYRGVSYYRRNKKYGSSIGYNKRIIFLGLYEDPELAHLVYLMASHYFHKTYAYSGERKEALNGTNRRANMSHRS